MRIVTWNSSQYSIYGKYCYSEGKTVCNACNSFEKSKEHLMLVKKAIKSEQCPLLLKKDHEDGGRDKKNETNILKRKEKCTKKEWRRSFEKREYESMEISKYLHCYKEENYRVMFKCI